MLVTGSSRGLGRAIAEAFLREGATVVINYVRGSEAAFAAYDALHAAHQAGSGGRPLLQKSDVTCMAEVVALFDHVRRSLGRPITTVVNNALPGFSFDGDARPRIDTLDWARVQAQLDGAVRGALNVVQAALPGMREAGHGRIVNIGTNLLQSPVVPYHDYVVSKGALLALTRTMAKDLGPEHITANMVSGGLLRTTDASAATPHGVFEAIAASTPLGQVTTPHEVADAVLFFAHPWSRGVTGQNLVVDGGLVMN